MENAKEFRRGDIVYVYLNENAIGNEGRGGRPAVVVSNDHINEHSGFLEVVYLTSKEKRPLATHVNIWTDRNSTVLCEQVHTVSKDRVGEIIMTCTEAEMQAIDKALMESLGLKAMCIPRTFGDVRDRQHEAELDNLKKVNATLVAERNKFIKANKGMVDRFTYECEVAKAEMYQKQFERLVEKIAGGSR